MAKLLYIESSPRKERSHSIAVARAFIDAYRLAHPTGAVDTWDLWAPAEQLPEFDGAAITAKYAMATATAHTPAEAEAWTAIGRSAERLKSADLLLLSVPMWNFGVPYKLKHLIDVVTQPGLTFGHDPVKGPFGLVPARAAVVVSARGASYAAGSPFAAMDREAPYLTGWLNWIGVADVRHVLVEPTRTEASAAEARDKATAEARTLAASL